MDYGGRLRRAMTGREETCCLKGPRYVAIMLAALTLGLGFCHLNAATFAASAWDQYLWVGSTVQGGLYAAFGSVGALMSIAAIVAPLFILAYFVRRHQPLPVIRFRACRGPFFFPCGIRAVVGAGLSGKSRAGDMGQRSGSRRLDQISRAMGVGPRDHRGRELLGFAALIWSVLADTPRWQPTPQRGRYISTSIWDPITRILCRAPRPS